MTHAAVRVSAPRGITVTRSRRVRRFWRSMDSALREAGLRPAGLAGDQNGSAASALFCGVFVESEAGA